jgi:hypothetical protein
MSNSESMLVEVMGLSFERIVYLFSLIMVVSSSINPLLVLTTKMLTHMCNPFNKDEPCLCKATRLEACGYRPIHKTSC